MNRLVGWWIRDGVIYFLKALTFAISSYLLIYVIYGGSRIPFFAWCAIVILAFAVAYIPHLVHRSRNQAKESGANKNER